MKLKDTGLTQEELKGLVKKYMIETYERFDFVAETAKDMYIVFFGTVTISIASLEMRYSIFKHYILMANIYSLRKVRLMQ